MTEVLMDLLRQAEEQLASIRAQRADLDRAERQASEKVAHLRALIDLETSATKGGDGATPKGASSSSSDMRVEDIAAEVLGERGSLHYRELWDEVARRGGALVSGNPAGVLLTRISRDDRFAQAKGRGVYQLASSGTHAARAPTKRRRRKGRRRARGQRTTEKGTTEKGRTSSAEQPEQ